MIIVRLILLNLIFKIFYSKIVTKIKCNYEFNFINNEL